MKPNIFEYATSELSQDAIICWLLEWSKKENKGHALHKVGIKFIDSIFKKFEIATFPYHNIEIRKQYKKIDILCIINASYVIIIEDKTNTSNHSNQLTKYIKIVEKDFSEYKLLPIYLKTGTQLNYKDVINDGYTPYLRNDFLEIMKYAKSLNVTNQILIDYSDYLEKIDYETTQYEKIPITEWSIRSWIGLFQDIASQFEGCGITGYGKSLGLYLHWKEHEKYMVGSYLRIVAETAQVSIKLESTANPKVKIKSEVKRIFQNPILDQNMYFKIKKANSSGTSVTIAKIVGDFRKTDCNALLNKKKTIIDLKSIIQLLDSVRMTLKV